MLSPTQALIYVDSLKFSKVHLFYFVSINVYFNVISVVFFTFWQEYYEI